jgi:adenylate cyclase
MGQEPLKRRLAAILAADVVGYSRLMEVDDEQTLFQLRRHRQEVFDPAAARHGGHIFKVMGDGFLVEFGSVLGAARCAIEIQRGMLERNEGVPEDRQFKFRMGINLGDIIVDGDDFYGDGVNMAVRLQSLARPGGIACSAAVQHELRNKVDVQFLDQGQKAVKNFANAVHVYLASIENIAPVVAAGGAGQPNRQTTDKPSVAVLPFANLSNDPEQEFFSDGVTEDIITDLSNVSGLFVLSRNMVFAYKNRARTLEHISRELGVAYVVQGSVRKSGNRVRINAELVEGATDGHLWAARYDRDINDIFTVQDEITKTIVEQLKVKLLPDEKKAIEQAPTASVEAYTHYLRGREYYHIASKANHLMARQSFSRALELDPSYARAYAGIAVCDVRLQSSYGFAIGVDTILATAEKALVIDPNLAEARAAKAFALSLGERRSEAAAEFELAVELDPDCHEAHRYYAEFCVTDGKFDLAAAHFIRALEIKPTDYGAPIMLVSVFRSLGEVEKAESYARLGVKKAEEELRLHPENANCACLGATVLAFLGQREEAIQWLSRSLATDPGDTNIQYNAACTYALLGEVDQAMELLERWVSQVGAEMRLWFRNDSDLDAIRQHPRYEALIKLAGETELPTVDHPEDSLAQQQAIQ